MKKLRFLLFIILIALLTRTVILTFKKPLVEEEKKAPIEITQEENILKQQILYEAGSNYLTSAYYGGKIVRWNKAEFPVKIFIKETPDMPLYYSSAFKEAANIWQNESNGIIEVAFVDNEEDANIIFRTAQRKEDLREIAKDETRMLAYTKPIIKGDNLKRAEIIFYDKTLDNKTIKPYEVLNVAVHEFGHAIGIWGHSDDKDSVMYAFYNPKQEKHSFFLNRQDKTTLKLLYSVIPDYTNGDKSLEKDTIRAEILTGTDDERIDASIVKAKKEAEMKKGDCSSRLNLVVLYEQKGDFDSMYKYLKEAEPLAKSKEELYGVNFAFAYYYLKTNDKQKALIYAKKALEMKDTEDVRNMINYIQAF